MSSKPSLKREPVCLVHQDKIWCERIYKERRHQRVYTRYTINPFTRVHALTGKPNSYYDQVEGTEDTAFTTIYRHYTKEPFKKYEYPHTEGQGYGWDHDPLISNVDLIVCSLHEYLAKVKRMELPKPPEEPEVKNIIDKLANFVARNGIAFEKMTKDKQKNNPKFSFLFGGQHYNYYQYRLTTEQQLLNKQRATANPQQQVQEAIVQQSIQNAPWQQPQGGFGGFQSPRPPPMQQGIPPRHMQPVPPWQQQQRHPPPWQQPQLSGPPGIPPQMHSRPIGAEMDPTEIAKQESELQQEEKEVQAKIKQSEDNLQRQHEVLMGQEKEQVEVAVQKEQDKHRQKLAADNHVSLEDFDNVLQPIINSCTKDSIANGKSWILSNSSDVKKCEVIAQQLLYRISEAKYSAKKQADKEKKLFDTQLHVIYLINDVLHHASRKNLENLSTAIESVIVPIFAVSHSSANDQNRKRLEKLLGLWNKFNYFNSDTMDKLSDPAKALDDYQREIDQKFSKTIEEVKGSIQNQYKQFQTQHEEYANHIKDELTKKRNEFEQQKQQRGSVSGSQESELGNRSDAMDPEDGNDYSNQQFPGSNRRHTDSTGNNPPWSDRYDEGEGDGYYENFNNYNQGPRPNLGRGRPPMRGRNFGPRPIPPNWRNDPMAERRDWDQDESEGGNWHHDGPGQEHFDDHNPSWGNRRGPPPGPAGPRALIGMPDDSALIPKAPYYDLPAGLMAPLVNLEDMDYKELDPSLIRLPPPVPPSDRLLAAVEAFYAPPSHERPRNAEGWEHNGLFEFFRAKVRARRRVDQGKSRMSRSRSRECRSYSRERSRSYSRSRSRSSSRSRSPSSRSRSRSNSRSPGRGRRPTPPSFGPARYQHNADPDGRLSDQNRGAQMMRKMGWGGAGLGSSEQGIQDPVKAGDVRDKYDQFKGLGMDMNDPYETYRKTRSYGYGPRARGREGN